MAEVPQCELFNGVVHWDQHVIWIGDGVRAHLARGWDEVWCGAATLDIDAAVDEQPLCTKCMTLALAESPLDSELWRFYKRTRRGDSNATPIARWCSTCGAAQRAGRCPRCD